MEKRYSNFELRAQEDMVHGLQKGAKFFFSKNEHSLLPISGAMVLNMAQVYDIDVPVNLQPLITQSLIRVASLNFTNLDRVQLKDRVEEMVHNAQWFALKNRQMITDMRSDLQTIMSN